ncbi:MAG: radical SAM protein [Dehalococcoidales bacterium]|nr:radical SAM protein [Dehalococcoidales bacterium]
MSISWETTARAKARLATERGAITKDWGGRLPVALVYPNKYYVGMSSLGFQIIYALLNEQPDVLCERAFYEGALAAPGETVLSLETQRPLSDFAAIAFSVTFELDYYNILATLRDTGLPLLSRERDERHPLIIGGGPCLTANPEPLAPFFDAIVVGEAEPVLPGILEVLRAQEDRAPTLLALSRLPGVYVPSFYEPVYSDDGRLLGIEAAEGMPPAVSRVWLRDLEQGPGSSVVLTDDTELANMYLVEVARGCAHGCRFCLAGYCFLPARERRPESVIAMAGRGLTMTKRIGLVGAAVSDYSHFEEVLVRLREMGAQVSVSSLRVDSFSEPVARALAESGARTVTLGLEAGSQHLRDLVHKGITEEHIARAIDVARDVGFKSAKLYYMIGLPGETDEDVQALVGLTRSIAERLERGRRGARVVVTLAPFVPKAQTPFQWMEMAPALVLKDRLARIRSALRARSVDVRTDSVEWAVAEGVLARGDRRLAPVLAGMDRYSLAAWNRSLARHDLTPDFYLRRPREVGEVLPWAAISTGVRPTALAKLAWDARRALDEQERRSEGA